MSQKKSVRDQMHSPENQKFKAKLLQIETVQAHKHKMKQMEDEVKERKAPPESDDFSFFKQNEKRTMIMEKSRRLASQHNYSAAKIKKQKEDDDKQAKLQLESVKLNSMFADHQERME